MPALPIVAHSDRSCPRNVLVASGQHVRQAHAGDDRDANASCSFAVTRVLMSVLVHRIEFTGSTRDGCGACKNLTDCGPTHPLSRPSPVAVSSFLGARRAYRA